MATTHNPTRTAGIEKRWRADIARRWREYRRKTLARLRNMPQLVVNQDPFVLSPEQQRVYMAYVQQQIDDLLLGTPEPPNWQSQYQLEAYQRGLAAIRARLISQGAALVPTFEEQLEAVGLQPFTATPSLSTGPIAQPVHQAALEFLFERSYESLQQWTVELARDTRQILFNGVAQGLGVREIEAQMIERMDISQRRARRIAQTETNQAYSRAAIAEIDRASEETGEEIQVRWITARDERVRHRHAELHGKVMTTEAAQKVKIQDGINCRCALTPVVPGTNTAKRRARFDAERAALLALERD